MKHLHFHIGSDFLFYLLGLFYLLSVIVNIYLYVRITDLEKAYNNLSECFEELCIIQIDTLKRDLEYKQTDFWER